MVLGLPKAPFWGAAAVAIGLAALAQLAIFVSELTSYLGNPGQRLRDMVPPTLMVAAVVITVTVPFVLPVVLSIGFDPIWWGIVTLTLVEIGMITPPIGMNVFVMKAVVGNRVKLSTLFGGVLPFLAADLFRMVLLIAFPAISLWLGGVLS